MTKLRELSRPRSLSDFPTLGGLGTERGSESIPLPTDLERTIPMEPVVLAQLCAATQISERRRTLPAGLEYSLEIDSPPDPSLPLPFLRTQKRQTLVLVLGAMIGLALGVFCAWRLDLRQAKSAHPAAAAPHAATSLHQAALPPPPAPAFVLPPSYHPLPAFCQAGLPPLRLAAE
jgi:hypothetical protein